MGVYRCTETGGRGVCAMLFTYNSRGVKGLVTVILRKFFKIIA